MTNTYDNTTLVNAALSPDKTVWVAGLVSNWFYNRGFLRLTDPAMRYDLDAREANHKKLSVMALCTEKRDKKTKSVWIFICRPTSIVEENSFVFYVPRGNPD